MIDRIASYFGYERKGRDLPRINNGADSIARGQRWEAFYCEAGGLGDMIEGLRRSYFAKVADLKPDDVAGLKALAMADRIAREIDGQVRNIIDTGKLRAAEADHVNKIAALKQ